MKQIVLVTVSVLIMSTTFAQQAADFGLWGGASSYFGDMTKVNTLSSLRPAYGVYLRYNFNPRYGVRVGYLTGSVGFVGEYEVPGVEMNFEKRINDYHALGEFNFFKYIIGSKKHVITTYLLGGFGVSSYTYLHDPVFLRLIGVGYLTDPLAVNAVNQLGLDENFEENLLALHATLGFGFKFNIGRRWGVGAEAQLRKFFNDKLDNLDDPRRTYNPTTQMWTNYTSTWHNNDWLVHFGVHVTYRFYFGRKDCPVYENLN